MKEKYEKGKKVKVLNEKSGKEHTFNMKTMKDQHGSYPVWYNPRKTDKKVRKKQHARIQRFKQQWTTMAVPF